MLAVAVSRNAFDRKIEPDIPESFLYPTHDRLALFNIVRGRFDIDDLADRSDHRVLPGLEMVENCLWIVHYLAAGAWPKTVLKSSPIR